MTHTANGPGSIDRTYRRNQAIQLRRQGWTFEQIADELGCSVKTVQRDVTLIREAVNADSMDEQRQLREEQAEVMRSVQAAAWEAFDGDQDRHAALGQIIRSSERLAKLYGLDAPARVQIGDDPLAGLTDELAAEILALDDD